MHASKFQITTWYISKARYVFVYWNCKHPTHVQNTPYQCNVMYRFNCISDEYVVIKAALTYLYIQFNRLSSCATNIYGIFSTYILLFYSKVKIWIYNSSYSFMLSAAGSHECFSMCVYIWNKLLLQRCITGSELSTEWTGNKRMDFVDHPQNILQERYMGFTFRNTTENVLQQAVQTMFIDIFSRILP